MKQQYVQFFKSNGPAIALVSVVMLFAIIGGGIFAANRIAGSDPNAANVNALNSNTNVNSAGDAEDATVDDVEDVENTNQADNEAEESESKANTNAASNSNSNTSGQKMDVAAESVNTNAQKTATTNTATQDTAKKDTVEEKPETYTATVRVVGPSGSQNYSVSIEVGATVEDLMKAAKAQGLSYSTKQFSGLGTYVNKVNGVEEDKGASMYWVYRVNGSKATAGISTKTLKKGDSVEWKYERAY